MRKLVFFLSLVIFSDVEGQTRPKPSSIKSKEAEIKKPIEFYFDELPSILWHKDIFETSSGSEKIWTILFPKLKVKGSVEEFSIPTMSKNYTIDGEIECLFYSRIWFVVKSEVDLNVRYTKGTFEKIDSRYDFCNVKIAEDRFEYSLSFREYLKKEIPILLNKITSVYQIYSIEDFRKLKVEAYSWDVKWELHKNFFIADRYQFSRIPVMFD